MEEPSEEAGREGGNCLSSPRTEVGREGGGRDGRPKPIGMWTLEKDVSEAADEMLTSPLGGLGARSFSYLPSPRRLAFHAGISGAAAVDGRDTSDEGAAEDVEAEGRGAAGTEGPAGTAGGPIARNAGAERCGLSGIVAALGLLGPAGFTTGSWTSSHSAESSVDISVVGDCDERALNWRISTRSPPASSAKRADRGGALRPLARRIDVRPGKDRLGDAGLPTTCFLSARPYDSR